MKKITLLVALLSCCFGSAQIIEFSNPFFKEYLLSANFFNGKASTETAIFNTEQTISTLYATAIGSQYETNDVFKVQNYHAIDTNGDGEIDINEASVITYLNLVDIYLGFTASDLAHFTNLKYLGIQSSIIFFNTTNTLDLSQNTALEMLNVSCAQNQSLSVDFSENTNLTHLFGANNNLFDVTQIESLPNLVFLNINNVGFQDQYNVSNINDLDVTQNPQLKRLYAINCGLTSLDVTQNPELAILSVYGNELSSLDVSQNPLLTRLDCYYNNITSLDVSQNPYINFLSIANNPLVYLNLKNGNIFPMIYLVINNTLSDLTYICADEGEISYLQNLITASQDININSYCNFTPGGTFYEVTGNSLIGNENTNCEDSDFEYSFLKFNITNGNELVVFFSDAFGNHNFAVPAGSNVLTPTLEVPDYFNVSPSSITVEFPATESPFEQNFCITPNGIKHDLEVTIIPLDDAIPGFDYSCKIFYRNKGNQLESPSLSFTYEDATLDFLSSSVTPTSESSGLLSWELEPLNVFESGTIIVNFNLNSPMETPPLNSEDILTLTATIQGTSTDETPNNNYFDLRQIVLNSYDPNDKTCLEGQSLNPDMIGEFVHYRIRFENTGTFPAQNVVIKDMIDAEKFDIATLQMVDASHDCRTRIAGQKVEFIFENIQLDFNDATNDGYVVFKIKTLPTLTLNSTISNTAEIYFDFNFPIITNTETSTFEIILSNENFTFENELILHPNPAKNILLLTSINGILIQDVEIYNLQGQKVMEIRNASENLDVSRLSSGTYLIKVFTNEGSSNAKFIKN